MKALFALLFSLLCLTFVFGQNEQSPIVEKDINYKNWTYKSIRTNEQITLKDVMAGKKLVIVVYFAPWCHNWEHDAPILNRLYDKYKGNGLEIVAIGEYDPVSAMRSNLETLKVTFPAVYESEDRSDKQKTKHYDYRRYTNDVRNWGSPWYIFLEPEKLEKKGDVLTHRTSVINGEIIESEGENFIRERLGLAKIDPKKATAENGKIEICDADAKVPVLKKP